MTVKILIVDPDIAFSAPLKRALEMLGDYRVQTFASGQPALEALQREAHDLVILDTSVSDLPLVRLVEALRRAQPWLYVLISAAEADDTLRKLPLNGIMSKPYFARGLVSILREVEHGIRVRQEGKQAKEAHESNTSKPPEPSPLPPEAAHRVPPAPIKPRTLPQSSEVNLRRAIADLAAKSGSGEDIPEPPLSDDATLSDVIRARTRPIQSAGQTQPSLPVESGAPTPPDHLPELPELPETHASQSQIDPAALMAAMTLEITGDDTIGIEQLPDAFEEQTETLPPDSRPEFNPMAIWAHADDLNEPTLVGGLTAIHPVSEDSPLSDEEMAQTFSNLLIEPPTEQTVVTPTPIDEQTSVKRALSLLGLGSVDELEPPPGEEPEEESVDPLARMALYLVQITTESAARVSILSKGGGVVASSGGITDMDTRACAQQVAEAWANKVITPGDVPAVFRYIELPSGADYLMYSIPTVEEMFLTMLFPGDVPLRVIRKQAHTLREALAQVPEPPESEAAKTLPSRPTELRPPQGLRESVQDVLAVSTPVIEPVPVPESAETPDTIETPQRPAVPYLGYTLVWLPRHGTLTPAEVDHLPTWIRTAAEARFWDVEGVEAQSNHVVVQIKVPEDVTPGEARAALQEATTSHQQPGTETSDLWSDVYYVAAGELTITPQDIADLLEFQREAQSQ